MLAGCERKEDGTWWFRMGAASKCESKDFPRVSDGNRVGIKRRVRVEKAVLGGVEEREKGQKDGEEGSRKERWRGEMSGRGVGVSSRFGNVLLSWKCMAAGGFGMETRPRPPQKT